MFDDTGGVPGCLGWIGLIIALVVALVLGCGQLTVSLRDADDRANDSAARLEQARAATERERAEGKVELENARAASWEHRFMLWTAYIEANDDDAPLVIGAILAAILLAGGLIAGWTLASKAGGW